MSCNIGIPHSFGDIRVMSLLNRVCCHADSHCSGKLKQHKLSYLATWQLIVVTWLVMCNSPGEIALVVKLKLCLHLPFR